LRVELFAPEPPLEPAALLPVSLLPVDFCAFDAAADLVFPDLSPPADVLAIGVLTASLAPAVFFGAADFDVELPFPEVEEPEDAPEPLEPDPLALLAAPELDDAPELLADVPDDFADPPELFDDLPADLAVPPPDELPELFDAAPDVLDDEPELFAELPDDFEADDPVEFEEPLDDEPVLFVAADFVEPFALPLDRDPDEVLPLWPPETLSIADSAAPVTAPAAAPMSTSPIASFVLS